MAYEAWGSLYCPLKFNIVISYGPLGGISVVATMLTKNQRSVTVAIFVGETKLQYYLLIHGNEWVIMKVNAVEDPNMQ